MNKKVSLKDIAQQAGVSTALVSYVLSGKEKESRVGREIASKIKEIAHELNYQPNHLAKSLRSGKTHTIGLIIADISNPFFANIARIVEDEAKKFGYTVIIGSSDENPEKSWDLLNVLRNRQVDGFIIVSSENSQNQIYFLKDQHIPFVLLDRYFPDIQSDFVSINNFKAAYDAGLHLIKNGYCRIGFIGYKSELFHMQERIRGYQQALKENNLNNKKNWLKRVSIQHIEKEVRASINELTATDNGVEAIIFATYSLAVNGLKYLNELKLKVPADVAIVSFGQAEVFDLYYCPITYLHQPISDLGKTAVELLIKKLKNPDEGMRQVLMEAKLICRESSEAKI
ncbi:LacI family DNA-binding transcriptional regulator [Adhaeribacter radiodurans]|uniref:Substrate-binding domain-containing protein n=1 Tax=Adhaeribacter radiodurans TaxID=2745197 RepID=A0A7L7L623_9BACT|nr:substrate-binding domain-containing protein [Adhaeribacter radiodurans]QMU28267.1 substrate-binding domain-containing protein [Adhaeribacter radiodurans]